jgi:hypothetical protein
MSAIYFNQNTKTFSVYEDQREYGIGGIAKTVGKFAGNHAAGLSTVAGTVGGSIIGRKLAIKKAKMQANSMGMDPDSEEYRRMISNAGKKGMLVGGASGAAGGYALGTTGKAIYNAAKDKGEGNMFKKLGRGYKTEWGSQGSHIKGAYNATVGRVFKKKDAGAVEQGSSTSSSSI